MKGERARWLLKSHDTLLESSIIYKLSLIFDTSPAMWILIPAHQSSIPENSLSHEAVASWQPFPSFWNSDSQNLSYEIMAIILKEPLSPCNIVIKEGHIFLTAAAAYSQTWITAGSWSRSRRGRFICYSPKNLINGRCTVWWSPGFRDLERGYMFHSQLFPDIRL